MRLSGCLFGWDSLDRPRQQGQGQGPPSQGTRQVAHQALEDHHQEVVSTGFPLSSLRLSTAADHTIDYRFLFA
jgi:hypothetical protein